MARYAINQTNPRRAAIGGGCCGEENDDAPLAQRAILSRTVGDIQQRTCRTSPSRTSALATFSGNSMGFLGMVAR